METFEHFEIFLFSLTRLVELEWVGLTQGLFEVGHLLATPFECDEGEDGELE